jgi:hypothetical protein
VGGGSSSSGVGLELMFIIERNISWNSDTRMGFSTVAPAAAAADSSGGVHGRRLGEGRERVLGGHRWHGRQRQRLRHVGGFEVGCAAVAGSVRPGGRGPGGLPVEPGVDVVVVVGVTTVVVGGRAPDGTGDLEDGLLLRGAEVEVGPSDAEAVDAVAVLALEAAELLDEVALGEARLGVAAHVLVEGGGVVLVGREGRAALRRELGEPAQDHDLVLVSHKCWNSGRRSPLGPTKNAKLGSAGKLMPSDSPLLAAEGSSTMG